ncbi:aldo/keto reductase [Hydrogenobacter thermophilus]|uniref:aldo/keto reductase n=1 Tax=Hydrogenobacter thermophilus TaxID=940 RepID=UPI0030F746E2
MVEYVSIPQTGIKVSRIGIGTWAIGGWMWGGTDTVNSIKALLRAFDMGLNLVDTAPVYGFGLSEEIVGKAIKEYGKRDKVVIATKVGLEWTPDGKVCRNASKGRIFKELEESLKRLRTDYIDIYQVHWPDPKVPFEETAEAMLKLYEDGKIRAIGVSNYSPKQMDVFKSIAPLHVCQPPYNLFERDIEKDVLPYCEREGILMLFYGAICRGLLSGKINKKTMFEGDDLRKIDPKFQEPLFSQYLSTVEELDKFARERYSKRVIHLAVRWLLDKSQLGVALWGIRRSQQLDDIPAVFGWRITSQDMQLIDEILKSHIKQAVGPEFMAPPVTC